MTDTETNFPPLRPLAAHARIEADLFCDQCGYNLHSQRVERDARLGILIVRCPECGRFQPAGVASNAQRVWLTRFSSILILLWCLFLAGLIFFSGMGLAGLQVGYVESLTRGDYISPEGVNAYRQWDPQQQATIWVSADTGKPVVGPTPRWQRVWRPTSDVFRDRLEVAVVLFFMNLAPTVFGGLLATLLWHVPRRRFWLALMIPLLAGLIVGLIFQIDEASRGDESANMSICFIVIACAAVSQMGFMLLGGFIGRPVARFIATLFVPPKARQAIGFLWTIDGKALPPVEKVSP
ncbi:MAG TPA: hypothetical protein PLD59_09985 [Tepidisphaeraceae bacterium]|nr:hypothetical protein [Tepidisphaeraceae bacterium]